MKNSSIKSTVAAAALLCGMSAANAGFVPLPTAGFLEDDNVEYVRDATGAIKTTGSLAVGDSLYAFGTFTKIMNADNTLFATLGAPGQEITFYSVIRVASIIGGVITFGTDATFAATYGAGAMVALFEQSVGDFTVGCTPLGVGAGAGTCLTTATNGDPVTPWLTAGLVDDGDRWLAGGALGFPITTPLEIIATTNAATKVALANFGLSVITNNTGYTFGLQACAICTDGDAFFVGSNDVLGGAGLTSPYVMRSDADVSFARIPEPGSLALAGLALLGLASSSRRRRQ